MERWRNVRTGQIHRARSLDTLARQLAGKRGEWRSTLVVGTYRIVRPARAGNGWYVVAEVRKGRP